MSLWKQKSTKCSDITEIRNSQRQKVITVDGVDINYGVNSKIEDGGCLVTIVTFCENRDCKKIDRSTTPGKCRLKEISIGPTPPDRKGKEGCQMYEPDYWYMKRYYGYGKGSPP